MDVFRVSVCVCTFNRAERLGETLAALQAMDGPSACDVEILVVDNNSSDDTRAIVEDAAGRGPFRVEYVFEPRQGKSFALNTAMERARGDVIALTDDDVIPSRQWLARI